MDSYWLSAKDKPRSPDFEIWSWMVSEAENVETKIGKRERISVISPVQEYEILLKKEGLNPQVEWTGENIWALRFMCIRLYKPKTVLKPSGPLNLFNLKIAQTSKDFGT